MSQISENMIRERIKRERISRDTEYEMISKRVGDVWTASHDAIKLFIQIFSAVLGGSVWIRNQQHHDLANAIAACSKLGAKCVADVTNSASMAVSSANYALASDALVAMVALLCGTVLWDNKDTWAQWRKRLDKITQGAAVVEIPFPHGTWWAFVSQNGMEGVSSLAMILAFVLFWLFNPFRSAPHSCYLQGWLDVSSYWGFFKCLST